MTQDDLQIITGEVSHIVFQNSENGWTVCQLEINAEQITVVGSLPFLNRGETLKVQGKWVEHPSYGRQFKAETYEKSLPGSPDSIFNYLSSGFVKGIGPVTARKIVDKFGSDTFEILENYSERLLEVKGITPGKAEQISDNFRQQFGVRTVMLFLQQYGIGPVLSVKIWRKWGNAASEIIKANPYILCEDIAGIGFERADKIAAQMGIAENDPRRRSSGIRHVLRHNTQNGHTFLPYDKLCEVSAELLVSSREEIEDSLEAMLQNGALISDYVGEREIRAVFLPYLYHAEKYIASRIWENTQTGMRQFCDTPTLIAEIESELGIKYAEKQREAMWRAVEEKVLILTGGPGTGKTTAVNGMLILFDRMKWKSTLAAPTGRAAKRMTELTGREAKTVHRLLEVAYDDGDASKFMRNEGNPIEADVVVLDEASMIDILLMENLLRAMKPGTRLILVGDFDQLPPVGAGNALRDMIASEIVPTVKLTEIFRQASESLIVMNAHRINNGEPPVLSQNNSDFIFLERTESPKLCATLVSLYAKRIPESFGYNSMTDIQVLTPTHKGNTGTVALNEYLQAAMNPPRPGRAERKVRDVIFREGDKVMQNQNDYNIEWEKPGGERGTGVFNGDLGIIEKIDPAEELMTVRFDERVCEYGYGMLDELELAYAITVHKSQGSEFPVVLIPLLPGAPQLYHRNLLYTAVTRARKMVIILGSRETVLYMASNLKPVRRYSALYYFLEREEFGEP